MGSNGYLSYPIFSVFFVWSMITSSTRHSNLSESKLIRVWARVWATACSVLDESWVSSMKHWMVMGLSTNRIPQVPVVYHYVPQYPIMQVSHLKKKTGHVHCQPAYWRQKSHVGKSTGMSHLRTDYLVRMVNLSISNIQFYQLGMGHFSIQNLWHYHIFEGITIH